MSIDEADLIKHETVKDKVEDLANANNIMD